MRCQIVEYQSDRLSQRRTIDGGYRMWSKARNNLYGGKWSR